MHAMQPLIGQDVDDPWPVLSQQNIPTLSVLLDAGILLATTVNRPRADVAYTICTLARRLSKTKNWIVGLVPYLSVSLIQIISFLVLLVR
jgi:hypothetical protein